MSNLVFLLGAVGLSILGSVLLWLRYRKPTTFMSSIGEYQRQMDALGRDPLHPHTEARGEKLGRGPTRAASRSTKPPDAR